MRFGNRAFKDWYDKACSFTVEFIDNILPDKIKGAKD